MSDGQPWTIKRLLDWTSEFFASRGTDSPRLAAEVLLAESLGCQRIELYTRFDHEPNDQQRAVFRGWVKCHADGEPVAYLVGHREFFSLRFDVDQSVLIPRPETEHLVSQTIEIAQQTAQLRNEGTPVRIVDIGTGSGAVVVALAKHLPDAIFTAVDISAAALDIARKNAERHKVAERIDFIESDLFKGVPPNEMFDIVVSNPPYIGNDERETVDASVKNYEPEVALFAPGTDGTTIIQRLFVESIERLNPDGWLLIEFSPIIAERCRQLLAAQSSYGNARTVKDLARLERILIAQRVANST